MSRLPGLIALALIIGLVALALIGLALAGNADDTGISWPHIRGLVAVSLTQATLSTVLSLGLGAALALALARRTRFPGRNVLIAAMNVATVLPTIVVVFAVVKIYGRAGWFGTLGTFMGLEPKSWLFGLPGILIAHIFFNAPLAARVYLASLNAVSGEHWRLATHLGMPPLAILRLIDGPVLRRETPGLASLIFLVCFTSFAIVLALGGGPHAATLEVAIFEALRFEAAFGRAALLAVLQIAICFAVLTPVMVLGRRPAEAAAGGIDLIRPDTDTPLWQIGDRLILSLGGAFLVLPLLAVLASGAAALDSLYDGLIVRATATSLMIGVPAGCLSTALAVALAGLARGFRVQDQRPRMADTVGLASMIILVVSPLAISAGLFVVLRGVINPFAMAPVLIMAVNALMALPFAYRQVEPPLVLSAERYGRLAESLGLRARDRIRLVDWPLLKRPLIVALAITTALSLGDLAVAAFFGSGDLVTLPLVLYRKLGAYRMDEAAAVSLLLSLLVLGLFLLAQRWSGNWFARAR